MVIIQLLQDSSCLVQLYNHIRIYVDFHFIVRVVDPFHHERDCILIGIYQLLKRAILNCIKVKNNIRTIAPREK
jgi:hypothetical protein